MKIGRKRFTGGFWAIILVWFFFNSPARVQGAKAAEEWVDIPVIVNVIDNSDDSNFENHLKKANEILKQAKIRLIVKKTNKPVNVGDNDGDLTEDEGNTASTDGENELKNTFKKENGDWNGKGIKIVLADDSWTEEPNNVGWSVHHTPVVVVETGHNTQSTGGTIAHELIHVLTVPGHSDDPNNLMYWLDLGQTYIDPNTIWEIFPEAKKRGSSYFILPKPLPGESVLVPDSVAYSIDAQGALLDDVFDLGCFTGDCTGFDPLDPIYNYVDVREIQLFADDPLTPGSTVKLDVRFEGPPPPPEIPSDFYISVQLDKVPVIPGPEGLVNVFGDYHQPETWEAEYINLQNPSEPPIPLSPPLVEWNDRLDGSGPIIDNHSIHAEIPIELVSLDLTSVEPIPVTVSSDSYFNIGSPDTKLVGDLFETFELNVNTTCCPEPKLCLIPNGVTGNGFTPEVPVGISLDSNVIGETLPNSRGDFLFTGIPDGLPSGVHSVIAKEMTESSSAGMKHAIAYFEVPDGSGPLIADLNGDGCVNLLDFQIFMNAWLIGC